MGLHLPETQSTILAELATLDLDEIHVGRALSSVTAVLRGARPGPTVLLRADMDALPISEETGLAFASRNDAMHACGHDLHMAGLVGAARLLAERRSQLAGTVVFAFQPGEEGHGGGRLMVEEGVLDVTGERPVACYAIHAWPTLDPGSFYTRPGPIMAGMSDLRATVKGAGGHASSPHLVRDPIPVAAEIVLALQSFATRRLDVLDPAVITVTQLLARSAAINVIPDEATLAASVRTLSGASFAVVERDVPGLIGGIAHAHGCVAEVEVTSRYPVTVNSAGHAIAALATLGRTFGAEHAHLLDAPLMASEDFAFFIGAAPGAFLLMGARSAELESAEAASPHSARVLFDDGVLDTYAQAMTALAEDALAAAR